MKQITLTPDILVMLERSGLQADSVVVYEAIALNTRPIRKRHPLYFGAVHRRDVLLEMAARVERESVPLQVMHDGEQLPIGRAFHGMVFDTGSESELRVLFAVDKTHQDVIAKIDSGTVDQVSVSVIGKQLKCSACGFDYFGEQATFENIFTGTCDQGHVLGEDGVHAVIEGLDQWFELSLVGQGGAENARIVKRDQSRLGADLQRLAAKIKDVDLLILTASADTNTGKESMDENLKALVAQITEAKVELVTLTAKADGLTASVAEKDTKIAELTAKVAELEEKLTALGDPATALTAAQTELATTKESLTAADTALRDVLTKVLTASGKVDETLPENLADVITEITANAEKMAAALIVANKADGAEEKKPNLNLDASAFRVRRK